MPRYFLEVSYKGTAYSGFQAQINANTIQAEIEKVIDILLPPHFPGNSKSLGIKLTGSSRTDAGVHALQNYFHFDTDLPVQQWKGIGNEVTFMYKMNAILPDDIVAKKLFIVSPNAHCRFDALSREYNYYIYNHKNPFLREQAFFYPYKLDIEKLQLAAAMIIEYQDFTSFSKRNTQAKTFICNIQESRWSIEKHNLVYNVKANRFLRGMVRALTATMLKVGRNTISIQDFKNIIEIKDCSKASFAVPPHGLFLSAVQYPNACFDSTT